MLAMSRAENAGRDILNLKSDETGLPHSRSLDAAVSRTDAVWILYAGAVCSNGGVWADGIPLLRKQQGDSRSGVRGAGVAVSAHLQDCAGKGDVERD